MLCRKDDEIAWADEPDHTTEPVTPVQMLAGHFQQGPTDDAIRVLIVDDDEEVHRVTLFTLSNLEIDGSKVDFAHARSSKRGKGHSAAGTAFCSDTPRCCDGGR